MGKSDQHVFRFYYRQLPRTSYNSAAFLGLSNYNAFTNAITSPQKDLYDLQLGNWDINDDWKLKQKYDFIICTRCAYFVKDTSTFIKKCFEFLNPGGVLLVDWGFGDHWRFDNFKVGWIRNNEHEFAMYNNQKCHLYSGVWDKRFEQHNEFKKFTQNILNKNYYNDLDNFFEIVNNEVPHVTTATDILKLCTNSKCTYDLLSLWPDAPQLYLCLTVQKPA
tara:strand:+ start:1700 stop:2359 length:660 start_codon:yes stop_codon:yes gene_type:complete